MFQLSLLPTPLRVHQNFNVHKYTTILTDGVKRADDEPAKFHTCTFKEEGVRENLTVQLSLQDRQQVIKHLINWVNCK